MNHLALISSQVLMMIAKSKGELWSALERDWISYEKGHQQLTSQRQLMPLFRGN
jgi:hypothetical protein